MKKDSQGGNASRNACKLCAPLGASVAYCGIEGCVPLVHGSQGCSTYIRRYCISHFREPMDVASSNFTESSAIFGGERNLRAAIENVARQYVPQAIGIATTCLTETIGDDVARYVSEYERKRTFSGVGTGSDALAGSQSPAIFHASTPSYRGTHIDGFHAAVLATVQRLAGGNALASRPDESPIDADPARVNVFPGFVSSEDLRELRAIVESFGLHAALIPDYSETLDGESWETFHKMPESGTPLSDVEASARANASLCLYAPLDSGDDAGSWLERERGVPSRFLGMPIGIRSTDALYGALEGISGRKTPLSWKKARGRLVDAYIDGHKYCFGKRVVIYGDGDFVVALASFLDEIGAVVAIAATGAKDRRFAERIREATPNAREGTPVFDDSDFASILDAARDASIDLVIGNSKGYYLSRNIGVPLVRCGFPIHDRMGGQRILHLGYRGTTALFDRVCNALMEERQSSAKSGYTYI